MTNFPTFYAHTKEGMSTEHWEHLPVHLERVAQYTERFAAHFGADAWGRLLGLWHDIGKYNPEFQRYLEAANRQTESPRSDLHRDEFNSDPSRRVDHSTRGAQLAVATNPVWGYLLAFGIAGHHAGLPNMASGEASLEQRLKKTFRFEIPHEYCSLPFPAPPSFRKPKRDQEQAFSLAFFARMLFSCLVDGDFLATEEFMVPQQSVQRPEHKRGPAELLEVLMKFIETKQLGTPSTVNSHRAAILQSCLAAAERKPGFFSLDVPTGGGKTLSSLAFGLAHAKRYGLERVIYAIPFTSIIEQTAEVFRGIFNAGLNEPASSTTVLEHHSRVADDDPKRESTTGRLAAENFDAPIVVTTNVQLFESMFACRTSRCRKLHRFANSVIILDEAQTLPVKLLSPTLAALRQLVENYGSTVVLCTATQPAIELRNNFPIGIESVQPIIADSPALHRAMQRTEVKLTGVLDNASIVERLANLRKVLCIVNTKKHAADLFKSLRDQGKQAIHLSASMCAAHRSKVLEKVRQRLASRGKESARVISTAVIEAGVDVDFPVVYRAVTGLDSIAQAAGRCNREGKLRDPSGIPKLGKVYVFDYDHRFYKAPPFVQSAVNHFRAIQPDHRHDLLSPVAIEYYFREHYWAAAIGGEQGWDEGKGNVKVMECFKKGSNSYPFLFQFRNAADAYQLIDEVEQSVLVPFGEGKRLIGELIKKTDPPSREFDRRCQRYVIGVREYTFRKLLQNHVLMENHGRYFLANSDCYDSELGLVEEGSGPDPERLIAG